MRTLSALENYQKADNSLFLDDLQTAAWDSVLTVAREKIAPFVEIILEGLEFGFKVLKSILKVVVLIYSEIEEKVGKVIAIIGLISILKPFYSVGSFLSSTEQLEKDIRLRDSQGIVWSAMDCIVEPFELLSGLLSFDKSIKNLFGISWLVLFKVVTSPLSIALLCYSTIKDIVETILMGIEYHQMRKIGENDSEALKDYLENKIGVTQQEKEAIAEEIAESYNITIRVKDKAPDSNDIAPVVRSENPFEDLAKAEFNRKIEVLKDKKVNKLKRNLDKKIVKYMINAKEMLNSDAIVENGQKSTLILKDIKVLTERKLLNRALISLLSVIEVSLTAASAVFDPFHVAVPAIFTALKLSLTIKKFWDNKFRMTNGLNYPELFPKKD